MDQFDNTQAMSEGWAISQCVGTDNGDNWRLEKMDDMDVFQKDYDAWLHVAQQALNGSLYHIRALKFLEVHQNNEFLDIENEACLVLRAPSLSHLFAQIPAPTKFGRFEISAFNSVLKARQELFTWVGSVHAGILQAKNAARDFNMAQHLSNYEAKELI